MTSTAIRSLRRSRGWTQRELAERLGTDPVTVSRWERGASRPRPSAEVRLRALVTPIPGDIASLIPLVGAVQAERLLSRELLVERRLPRPRFSAKPADRLREVDRVRAEQEAFRAAVGRR